MKVFILTFVLAIMVSNNAAATDAEKEYTRNVAIVIWNGAEILDWTGPSEVFQAAASFGTVGDTRAYNVYTVSKTTEPIVSQRFITVVPEYSIENAPKPDIIVLPGGGVNSVRKDPEFLAWATQAATHAEIALSVCTGAFILGDAGLLDGKDATTWYGATAGLEETFPEANVIRGRRYVDNGHVVTTAGVSAGIDGALHVVARTLGRYVADRTAQYMEYRWTAEPYLATKYTQLNPSLDERGRAIQRADIYRSEENYDAAIAVYQRLLEDDSDPTVWMGLGKSYLPTEDYESAVKAFKQAAKSGELADGAYYNLACAYALMGDSDDAIKYLEMSVEAGFMHIQHIAMDPDLASIIDDPRVQQLVDNAIAAK